MSQGEILRAARPKLLNDTIHRTMEVPQYCIEIMDTPEFQRLRSLKQLGVTSYVFPGATHTRFEHSVGVSHLANRSIKRFQRDEPHLNISDREVQLVTIAGLCHDLGHGPFSHAFEGWMRKIVPHWEHEDQSVNLLKSIFKSNLLSDCYSEEEVEQIALMIHGVDPQNDTMKRERGFLYEIVANKRNNIDVDKFDYLARDSYHCGMPVPDFERLMMKRRILKAKNENVYQICYHSKEGFSLSEMFRNRFSMFRTVYCHEVGIAIEHMLRDILTAANEPLKIAERAMKLADYMVLTDAILNEIECSRLDSIQPAQALLLRLRRRDLYKTVGKATIRSEHVAAFKSDLALNIHQEAMLDYCDASSGVTLADLDVHLQVLTFGQGSKDPLRNTLFYQSLDPEESRLSSQIAT